MSKTDFQMFVTTFLLATPSTLNNLIVDPAKQPDDFVADMKKSEFKDEALTRVRQDVFPNLQTLVPVDPLLIALRAQTTLRGIFAALAPIVHLQLNAIYGGGTIHPAPAEVIALVNAAKAIDARP